MTTGLTTDEDAAEWLLAFLGPGPGSGTGPRLWWCALPSRRRPHRLIPLGCAPATRAVLGSVENPLAGPLALATRLGLPPGRHRLSVARHGSFVAWICERLDREDLHVGVSIGPPRPNRKPVLQVVDGDGDAIAWVKIAWNDLTRSLVANETRWLRHIVARETPGLEVPHVLDTGSWNGFDVLITRPLPVRRTVDDEPGGLDLVRTIASLGPEVRGPLGASDWWATTIERIAAVVDPSAGSTLRCAAQGLVEDCGDGLLTFGAWHGDLARQNLRRCDDRIQVWDWERAGDGRPLAIDIAHARFRDARDHRGAGVARAAALAESPVAEVLDGLGSDTRLARPVVTAYLIERWLRWDEDARLGSTTPTRYHHDDILAELGQRASG